MGFMPEAVDSGQSTGFLQADGFKGTIQRRPATILSLQ